MRGLPYAAGNLKPEDAKIVNMPCTDAVTSLHNGDVDGIVVWEAFVTMATNKEGIVEFADAILLELEKSGCFHYFA